MRNLVLKDGHFVMDSIFCIFWLIVCGVSLWAIMCAVLGDGLCLVGRHKSDGDYGHDCMGRVISECRYCGKRLTH